MADKNAGKAGDMTAVAIAGGNNYSEPINAPYMQAAAECWRRGEDGKPYVAWRDGFDHNAVMTQGLVYVINHVFGSLTNSTGNAGLFLHYATVGSGNAWSNISGSIVSGYGNNIPIVTFASNGANMSQSASASYTFNHAGTQTVSGCGIVMANTNSISTNVASQSVMLYNYGTFTNGTRGVQSNDTLQVTQTLTYITA